MDIDNFKTAGEWYKQMKADGYDVPLSLYYALIRSVKDEHFSLQEAYKNLVDEGRIIIKDKKILFDMNHPNTKSDSK